jgi:putative SOS response-associated peptidase YedK
MCGRYTLTKSEKLAKRFNVATEHRVSPSFNAAPSQIMPVVVENDGGRQLEFALWGIHREFKIGGKNIKKDLINTRSDKAFTGFWSKAVKTRRCLVPATGFFEWDKILDNGKIDKQPYYIHPKDLELFAFAGIYELGHDKQGKEIVTFSIMTTESNKEMSAIHDRLPIMLHQDDESSWLSPAHDNDRSAIEALLRPWEDDGLEMFEIGSDVNNPRNNYPELLYPLHT